jgi:hypothetical protein
MMGIRNWHAVARGRKEWGRIVFETKRSVALGDDDDDDDEEEEKKIIIIIIIIIFCTPITYFVVCSHLSPSSLSSTSSSSYSPSHYSSVISSKSSYPKSATFSFLFYFPVSSCLYNVIQ